MLVGTAYLLTQQIAQDLRKEKTEENLLDLTVKKEEIIELNFENRV